MRACDTCKNAIVNGEYCPRLENNVPTCLAFPNGIPMDILEGAMHDDIRPEQDNDIVYEVLPLSSE